MYNLVALADVVQLPPSEFQKPSVRAVEDWINAKYADKVLHKVGLCVGFHSLISAGEGLIGHGTGIVNINVEFRLVVFRPFKGEIVRATVNRTDMQRGIDMTMDFFDDIHVPAALLPDDTELHHDEDNKEGVFVWNATIEDGTTNGYYFDKSEKCMVRIESEEWTDLNPKQNRVKGWEAGVEAGAEAEGDGETRVVESIEGRKAPYKLIGSMALPGLGPSYWWGEDDAPNQGEEGPNEDADGGAATVNGDPNSNGT